MGAMNNTFSLGGDLTINRLGFGAMRLAGAESGIAVLRRAVELGVNHIDTAAFYGRGTVWANDLIRTALTPYREDLVIATKVGPLPGPDGLPTGRGAADQLRGLVEADLRTLGVDRLDLVYLRANGAPGSESIADRFAVLAELRAQGVIRHLGVSHVDAAQLAEARAIAPVVAVQNLHTPDRSLLEVCEEAGIAYVPYFPLGGGIYPLEGLDDEAARLGVTVAQVQLARLLASSPSVLAIPGTGSVEHLEENMAANSALR
ncbi:oxidoreductase [Winogradskya humida]|uniref:Oxidoreductase n=2 Tax=Winogradskya humida TaxID=113566 RepID=A0ABQ3ZI94_9ACTN|nr:oxidoreductase [Actinoplanes humidus]